MKHVLLYALSLITILLLTACGISQSEYDSLQAENDALIQEIQTLEEDNSALNQELQTLSAQITSLTEEKDSLSTQVESLSEYKANHVQELMDESYGKAWATTAFGDDSICFSDADSQHFQCISAKTYPMTNEGISALWSDILVSVTTLGYAQAAYSGKINYATISISFFDPSGTHILDVALKRVDDSYTLDSITCNILYTNIIASALMSVQNN